MKKTPIALTRVLTRAGPVSVCALLLLGFTLSPIAASAAPTTPQFVQINSTTPGTPQTSVSVAFTAAQTAGDTNVVVVGFSNATSTISSVIDSAGNIYQIAAPLTRSSENSEAVYFAPSISGAAADSNTVTVKFSAATNYPDIRIVEYANLASTNTVDGTSSNNGTGSPVTSGNVSTTTATDLIFGAGDTEGVYTGATDGSTVRIITSPDADIVADRTVTATGSYGFSAAQDTSGDSTSVTQVVAFKAAGATTTPDTTPPSVPTNLTASAVSSSAINLSWTASTDNVGVTGYKVFRGGTQVGTAPTATYQDTGLIASTAYSYTVAAYDAAGNVSAPSGVATTTTKAASAAPTTPQFVQINSTTPGTPQTSVSVAFTAAQTAGDTNVVVVGFSNATSTISSVIDSAGNIYQIAAPLTRSSENSEAVYFAPSISGAAADSNTVTVKFSAATNYPDIRIVEYANLASTNTVDGTSSNNGTGSPVTSGNVSTTTATDLIFGAGDTEGVYTGATDGSTVRIITSPDADIVADRTVTATGSYGFSAAQDTSGDSTSVTQVVAFKAAGATTTPDTTPPSVPTNLTASAVSSSAINLSWTASTDNVGVTGYKVFRGGTQVGTAPTATYQDTGLIASTAYSYTVAAYDAAGNVSAPSGVATTTTKAASAAPTTPQFVQINSTTPGTPQTSVSVAFTAAQTAGDTNVVVVGFSNATSTISSVIDSAGNIYQIAAPLTRSSENSEAVYFAPSISGAAADSNTVTVKFSAATNYPDIRIVEYANLASTNTVDGTSSNNGTGSPVTSGNVSTTTATDLIFGAGDTEGVYTGATDGSTVRIITSPDADIVADRTVTATGSYGFSAAQDTSGDSTSVTQVVAFKAAGATTTVNVMPLGDSITDGYLTPGGYRTELWQLLVNQDHDNINFVGSQSTGALAPGDPVSSGDDEGHVGWCIGLDNSPCDFGDDLSSDIVSWLTTYQPNIILLHAGTNDIASGDTGAQVTTNMDDFLDQIFTTLPHTDVVLAQIIPIINVQPESNYASMETAWQQYNAAIPGLVTKYQNLGYNIQLVNMSDVLDPTTDYATGAADPQDDDFHPNLAGYDIMAQTWYPFVKALYSTF